MTNNLIIGSLITTMNKDIEKVKKYLLPQLKNLDEIVISHQITNKSIQPEDINELKKYHKNIKYNYMYDRGLSKNRNNALKLSEADICIITDDDLKYLSGFEEIIKEGYKKFKDADLLTFQALKENGKFYYPVKEGKHTLFSIGRVGSIGITFKRKKILEKGIKFDEKFGLGAKYPVGEENIFLRNCQKSGLKLYHCNIPIVRHPSESSGIQYRDELIKARIKVFKRMYGILGALAAIPYFTILHYRCYKAKYSILKFLLLSFKGFMS